MELLVHHTGMEVLVCLLIHSSNYLEFSPYDRFISRWIHVILGDSCVSWQYSFNDQKD